MINPVQVVVKLVSNKGEAQFTASGDTEPHDWWQNGVKCYVRWTAPGPGTYHWRIEEKTGTVTVQ